MPHQTEPIIAKTTQTHFVGPKTILVDSLQNANLQRALIRSDVFTWARSSMDPSPLQTSQTPYCTDDLLFSRLFERRCCSRYRGSVNRSKLAREGSPMPCPSWRESRHRRRYCRRLPSS